MCMSQAWENALWALMCQERLGILMTIMEGQQLKGMYHKNKRCGLKTLNILRKDTSDRTCHRMMQSCWKNLVFVVSSWVVKLPGADPFMEWTVETVLPREVWKLASAIEEKDAELAQRDDQIEALEFTNEEHQQKILRLNEEMNDLVVNRPMSRRGYFDNELCFIKKNSKNVHPYYVIRCQYRQLEKHKRWLKLRYSWRWLTNVMNQMLFIGSVDLSVKWSRGQATTKTILAWLKRSKHFYVTIWDQKFLGPHQRLQNIIMSLYIK